MKFDVIYASNRYPVDLEALTLPDAFTVKSISGLALGPWQNAVFDFDPDAVLALVVLALRKAGKPTAVADIDHDAVDVQGLAENITAAARAKRAAQSAQTA